MPVTLRLRASCPADVARAAYLLRGGRLVAFATETVYGLGANALSVEAVRAIFAAKGRPAWDPVIVHLATEEQLAQVAEVPAALRGRVEALTAAFWPGPLTLLLPRSAAIDDVVTAGRPLVGVRVPAHQAAHVLLTAAGVPVAAPSANRFGHTSPTSAAHVLADLDGRIDAVLDAGPSAVGVESTVLDPGQTPMVIYRPGAVTADQIRAACGVEAIAYRPPANVPAETPAALPSPGVGIRHYAPRARLVLVEPDETSPERSLLAAATSETTGVLLPEGWAAPPGSTVFAWGNWDDAATLAARLFAGMRALDDGGVAVIVCPLPRSGGLGDALRDRLAKAARTA